MLKIFLSCFFPLIVLHGFSQARIRTQEGFSVIFKNTVNGKEINLGDTIYRNAFGEKYTVKKLKYYVSNLSIVTNRQKKSATTVFLVDAAKENRFQLAPVKGKIIGIEFLIGVDSLLNFSGAQTGALDPLNDMFWTWNNGYVTFKLEGWSDSSKADQQRIEHHLGGFKYPYATSRKIVIPIKDDAMNNRKEIIIEMSLDKYWQSTSISEIPVITLAGEAAAKMCNSFKQMFSVKQVSETQ